MQNIVLVDTVLGIGEDVGNDDDLTVCDDSLL